MNLTSFLELVDKEIAPKGREIVLSKGESYSGLEDKLGNFKRAAKLAGVSPFLVWFIYFIKHFDALCSWIRGEYKDSESIEGRLVDMRNYLDLLYALIREAEK